MASEGTRSETRCIIPAEDIVAHMDMSELRSFVLATVRGNEALERELRSTYGRTSMGWAVRELQKATDTILRRCALTEMDEWEEERYTREYRDDVEEIMRPFLQAEDAESLVDLLMPRLEQLRRLQLEDCEGFYTDVLSDVYEHLEAAFEVGDDATCERLFRLLRDFLEEDLGEGGGDAWWHEQRAIEEFLGNRFAWDTRFAPAMVDYADLRLGELTPCMRGEWDLNGCARESWARVRLASMAARGDSPDEVYAWADEHDLPGLADTVRALADAYATAGDMRNAAALVRENLDARERRSVYTRFMPTGLVGYLEEYAEECYGRDELTGLYRELLSRKWNRSGYSQVTDADLWRWYDRLRRVVGDAEWDGVRAKVLEEVPYVTGNALLAREGHLEELYERIMANDGEGLAEYEDVLSDLHPEAYVELYIGQACLIMERARDRYAYGSVADRLARAAELRGGREPAAAAARELARTHPRKRAFISELRRAGFAV